MIGDMGRKESLFLAMTENHWDETHPRKDGGCLPGCMILGSPGVSGEDAHLC